MHLIKYKSQNTVLGKYGHYMFRHWSAIFRESVNTKGHKTDAPHQVLIALSVIFKQIGLILITNCVLLFVCYAIVLSAFVGQCTEHTTVAAVSYIQYSSARLIFIQKWPAFYVTRRMAPLSHYGRQCSAVLSQPIRPYRTS